MEPRITYDAPRWEWTPKRVQNILLTIGAALCSLAALLFAAYAWGHLGLGGRIAALSTVTAIAVAGGVVASRRGLSATAEALTGLSLVLSLIDAGGAYRLNLAGVQQIDASLYGAATLAASASFAANVRTLAPTRIASWFTLIAAQLPVPLLVLSGDVSSLTAAVALLNVQVVVVVSVASRLRSAAQQSAALGHSVFVFLATAMVALVAAFDAQRQFLDATTPLALVALGAMLTALVLKPRSPAIHRVATAAAVVAVVFDAIGVAVDVVSGQALSAVVAAIGVAIASAAHPLRSFVRRDVTIIGTVLGVLSAVSVAIPVAVGVLLPFLTGGSFTLTYGEALAPVFSSPTGVALAPTAMTLVTLGLAAVAFALAGRTFRNASLSVGLGVLTAAIIAIIPVTFAMPFAPAVAWFAIGGLVAVLTAMYVRRSGNVRSVCVSGGLLLLAQGLCLALRMDVATVLVSSLVALVGVALNVLDEHVARWSAPLSMGSASLALAVGCAAAGLPTSVVGTALAIAGLAVTVAALFLQSRRPFEELLAISAVIAVGGAGLAASDSFQVSIVLLALTAAAGFVAIRPGSRDAIWVSGMAMVVFTWIRCAVVGIDTIEAYSLPLAVLVLVAGHVWGRRLGQQSSWTAYGAGLALAFVPSVGMLTQNDGLTRHIAISVAALVVMIAGSQRRLQAPIAFGATVLVIEALAQFAPQLHQVPRWMGVGAAGALLLALGASWERRYRDMQSIKAKWTTMR